MRNPRHLRGKTQLIRDFIADNLEDQPTNIVGHVAGTFKISRQAAHGHIANMMREGQIGALGKTAARRYFPLPQVQFRQEVDLTSTLQEDLVWKEVIRPRLGTLKESVESICYYGFTEMVNNAIDHSAGERLTVSAEVSISRISLTIGDNGIGIFNKLQRELGLDNPRQAILELYKGKVTTDPEHHSGEGIYFTSRMFDGFTIQSGPLGFVHLKSGNDYMVTEDFTDIETAGTLIKLDVSPRSQRTPEDVFGEYTTGEDLGFTRTKIPVLLTRHGNENLVSRSQAKRLLSRLNKFKEIWLDFEDVETIGQGFADEVFRIYARQNPDVEIMVINASKKIEAMINHVKNNNEK
jgi:hypothetical protein